MPPAARVTDMHVCPMVTVLVPHVGGPIIPPGVPTVLIDMLPAANVTTMATCVGPPDIIVKGSSGVFLNFLPAARMGDQTAHGGVIILGSPTCIIGEVGSGSPGAGGMGGVVAGLAVSNATQLQQNSSVYSKAGSGGPVANAAPTASQLTNSTFNAVAADRVCPGTNGQVAVIGRSMDNAVVPYTSGLQQQCPVETFSNDKISPAAQLEWKNLKKQYAPDPIPSDVVAKSQIFKENQAWAQKLADQGYTVVDVDNPGKQADSPFYEMESKPYLATAALEGPNSEPG